MHPSAGAAKRALEHAWWRDGQELVDKLNEMSAEAALAGNPERAFYYEMVWAAAAEKRPYPNSLSDDVRRLNAL